MPHDIKGNVIKEGDYVLVPCKVKTVNIGEEYCNLSLETVYPMPPYTEPNSITLNTKQVFLSENGEVAK